MNNAFTPSTLGDCKFCVPLYQRPYAWEERQVRQLMEDFTQAFKEAPGSDYHLGILSVAKGKDGFLELIDGQQRITTLALIAKSAGQNWFAGKLKFHGRPLDQAFILKKDQANCNPRMKLTVAIATEYLNKEKGLSEYILAHASFFLSEVPQGYTVLDKNQQFVRFNNRGRQLEKHEILKVKLISRLPEPDQAAAFTIWNSMVLLISGAASTQENMESTSLEDILRGTPAVSEEVRAEEPLYRSIVTIPEFLLIALERFASEQGIAISHDSGKLLETFLATLDAAPAIQKFIELLKQQTEMFRKYFIFISKGDECYVVGQTMEGKQLEWENGDKQAVIDVQSFLHVSTKPHRWLVEAFDWLQQQTNGVSAKSFVTELELHDRRRHAKLPALSEMRFGEAPHYWFFRLDYELLKEWRKNRSLHGSVCVWKGLAEEQRPLIDRFRFRQCGSIEHILPQHEIETSNRDTNKDKDRFGNLALISSSCNSKFSNNPSEEANHREIRLYRIVEDASPPLVRARCRPTRSRDVFDVGKGPSWRSLTS
jgi:hypothetical protein